MSSHHGHASSANDPRQPSSAKPYVPPTIAPQDLPVDYSGFIAIVFGITGVMLRHINNPCLGLSFCPTLYARYASKLASQKWSMGPHQYVLRRSFFYTLQYKLCSWLAIIFCAQSLANMKNMENDLKQISMAMMMAIMGLVTNYLGPARPGSSTSKS